jgi:excisionase family DNA binding protein
MTAQKLINSKSAAKELGITPRALQKLANQGKVPSVREGRKMLFDLAAVKAARARNLDPFRGGKHAAPAAADALFENHDEALDGLPPEPDDDDHLEPIGLSRQRTAHWRARAMRNEAKLGEVELKIRTGALVEAEDVRRQQFRIARAFRDRMLNIPDRVASVLAAETDAGSVHAALTKEIRDACAELAALDVDQLPD